MTKKHKANTFQPGDHGAVSSDDADGVDLSTGHSQSSVDSSRASTGRRRRRRFLARGIVEYARDGFFSRIFRRGTKTTGLLLNMSRGGIQFLVGRHLKRGDRLLLSLKLEGIYDLITLRGEVKWSAKVLTQDSYRVGVEFVQYTTIAERKLRGLEADYLPRHHKLLAESSRDYSQKYPILTDYKLGLQGPHADGSVSLHAPAAGASARGDAISPIQGRAVSSADAPSSADAASSSAATIEQSTSLQSLSEITDTVREAESSASTTRFDEIVEDFKGLEVDDRLILDVFEAIETGINLNSIFKSDSTSTVATPSTDGEPVASPRALGEEDRREASRRGESRRNLIPVYSLNAADGFHFDEEDRPVGAPVAHMFVSSVKDKDSLFAFQITDDSMEQKGTPSFQSGDILMFSTKEKVENGDFAFVRTKPSQSNIGIAFRQVFFDDEDSVRLRPLNNKHREETYDRRDVESIWRIVGRYEAFW